jgi:hypothetical protein
MDSSFKAKARLHQSKFRENFLKADCERYGNQLSENAALSGKNFYSGYDIFKLADSRFPAKYSPLYYDMLRSEHIPFNFFAPFRVESQFSVNVLNSLLGVLAKSIGTITFEFSPPPPKDHLDDNTAFDVFIEYGHSDGSEGVLGIEVKYTERDYGFGVTERGRIFNPKSRYSVVSNKSGIYNADSSKWLKTRRLKQFWRNQLLGESMLQLPGSTIKHFTSVILFPSGNIHMSTASTEYSNCLIDSVKTSKFRAVTFEHFLDVANECATSPKLSNWLSYLRERYIVKQ